MSSAPGVIPPCAAEDSLLLYASWGCPYSHRVLAALAASGLREQLPIVWMKDVKREPGWEIDGQDPVFGARTMPELYQLADPEGDHRPATPLLVEKNSRRILSTESRDMVRFISAGFGGLYQPRYTLCPPQFRDAIDELTPWLREAITRAVYRVGTAGKQDVYAKECVALFESLDRMEARLAKTPYLMGDDLTEADLFLFPTLARFDAIYGPLFRCSLKRIADYPALSRYTVGLLANPLLSGSFDLQRAKRHYYLSVLHRPDGIFELNPSGILPL